MRRCICGCVPEGHRVGEPNRNDVGGAPVKEAHVVVVGKPRDTQRLDGRSGDVRTPGSAEGVVARGAKIIFTATALIFIFAQISRPREDGAPQRLHAGVLRDVLVVPDAFLIVIIIIYLLIISFVFSGIFIADAIIYTVSTVVVIAIVICVGTSKDMRIAVIVVAVIIWC